MPEIVLSSQVAAEPASLALLLAGPTAVELWPGARRIGEFGDRLTVEADLPDGEQSEVHLQALPPHRTPTSFVIRFEYSGDGVPRTNGTITLTSQGNGSSRVPHWAALKAHERRRSSHHRSQANRRRRNRPLIRRRREVAVEPTWTVSGRAGLWPACGKSKRHVRHSNW